ncbi:SWF1 [Mytilus edulis]|uniref:Palmitoyltransferase n=1 Tax=Mytilus edulis TaxID=6550 RepID=A0A8S3TAN0_MYTED|nr:SWF1 [Mytilus edulis]
MSFRRKYRRQVWRGLEKLLLADQKMEFLQIVVIYVLLFFLSVGLYFYRDSAILRTGIVGKICTIVSSAIRIAVPKSLTMVLYNASQYFLYTRNQCMKVLFGVLVLAGNIICIMDMLPLLYKYLPDQNHTLIPIINAFASLYFFHKCCNGDPGEITPLNLEKYQSVYPYDERMYVPNAKCRTCKFVKPARSKHCSICNRCVHRFDHHCLWTNNDVGGLNHGYFVLFLLTMMFKCIWGFYVGIKSLVLYTQYHRLLETQVMTSNGEMKQVTYSIVLQHLFMQFPRLVFIVTSLFFLIILLGIFTIYHVNVVLTNRTTNERYKAAELEPINIDSKRLSSNKSKLQAGMKLNKNIKTVENLYDKGIIGNIYDTFWHRSIVKKIKFR